MDESEEQRAEGLGFKVGGSYRWREAALRMGPLWDWMTHPFTLTPPGIASAPAAFSSAAVGPSHAAAEAISPSFASQGGCVRDASSDVRLCSKLGELQCCHFYHSTWQLFADRLIGFRWL